jgi:DNA-binding beta-propeller fold protein YncE
MFILTLALLLGAACGDQGSAKDEKAGTQSAGRVTETLRIPIPTHYMAIGTGSLWMANDSDYTITRVDLAKSEVVAKIKASGDSQSACDICGPQSVSASGDQIWFTDRITKSVSRIDPETNRIVESIPVGILPYDIAIDGDTLWVTDYEDELVVRVDTDKKRVVSRLDDFTGPAGIVVGAGSVWVMDHTADLLIRIDPQTNEIVEEIPIGYGPESIAFGEGGVWTANFANYSVSHVDPETNKEVARIRTGSMTTNMYGVAVGGGSVWATGFSGDCGKKGVLLRIDPKTDKVVGKTNIPCAFGVAATDDAVWVQGVVKEEGKWTDHLMRVKPTVQ